MSEYSLTSAHRMPILRLLSLSFLLLGLFACSDGTKAEEDAAASPSPAAQTQPGAAPGAPGSPGAAPSTPGGLPSAPPSGPPIDPAQLPAVVAKLQGGQEIKKDELINEAKGIQAQLAARGGQVAPSQDFYRRVLDTMIAQRLLLAEAKAQGVTVSDTEVKTQIDGLRGRFPDAATFQKALASQGMTEARMTQELRNQLLLRHYIETKVLPQVQVTDAQAKAFYDQNQDKMKQPELRHLRHILVAKPQGPGTEAGVQQARAKAEGLRARLEKGEDFAQLATANSDDPGSKDRGGDLGWLPRGRTVPAFEQAAWALQVNQLSPVVESQFGFHIIQMTEPPRPESVVPFEQAREQIQARLRQQATQDAVKARAEALRAQAKVETFI
jgi:peptidyl-prolyl cis-trans isomerase C